MLNLRIIFKWIPKDFLQFNHPLFLLNKILSHLTLISITIQQLQWTQILLRIMKIEESPIPISRIPPNSHRKPLQSNRFQILKFLRTPNEILFQVTSNQINSNSHQISLLFKSLSRSLSLSNLPRVPWRWHFSRKLLKR